MNYWLMKSEPDLFGIDDLQRVAVEPWDGVRNFQARNMLRDQRPQRRVDFGRRIGCNKILQHGRWPSEIDPGKPTFPVRASVGPSGLRGGYAKLFTSRLKLHW